MNAKDEYIQTIIERQRILIDARTKDIHALKQKLSEYEQALLERDHYVAKLELDLEHAIGQCKMISENRSGRSQWINRQEPGLERA